MIFIEKVYDFMIDLKEDDNDKSHRKYLSLSDTGISTIDFSPKGTDLSILSDLLQLCNTGLAKVWPPKRELPVYPTNLEMSSLS